MIRKHSGVAWYVRRCAACTATHATSYGWCPSRLKGWTRKASTGRRSRRWRSLRAYSRPSPHRCTTSASARGATCACALGLDTKYNKHVLQE
eukprot:1178776-Prorocentrum_minimum.AAC.4